MYLQKLIEKHWYYKNNAWLLAILLPSSLIFFLITQIRFLFYKFGIFKVNKLKTPVVIVGNISVGGVGKTPLTRYLATELTKLDISVGVVLHGYKSNTKGVKVVMANDNSDIVGDEALLYAKDNIKVAIGGNRYQAGLELLKKYPEIQLILSDDGLQHYSLYRDYEICVVDGVRMFGNKFVLPMGPLREIANRLRKVDAVVINGMIQSQLKYKVLMSPLVLEQKIVLDKIYNYKTKSSITINEINKHKVVAVAAIGDPERFFAFISNLGVRLDNKISFVDHHKYTFGDMPSGYDIILVTEKDYVKLSKFNLSNIWVVLIKTQLQNTDLIHRVRELILS